MIPTGIIAAAIRLLTQGWRMSSRAAPIPATSRPQSSFTKNSPASASRPVFLWSACSRSSPTGGQRRGEGHLVEVEALPRPRWPAQRVGDRTLGMRAIVAFRAPRAAEGVRRVNSHTGGMARANSTRPGRSSKSWAGRYRSNTAGRAWRWGNGDRGHRGRRKSGPKPCGVPLDRRDPGLEVRVGPDRLVEDDQVVGVRADRVLQQERERRIPDGGERCQPGDQPQVRPAVPRGRPDLAR